jgi:hypothetical protein
LRNVNVGSGESVAGEERRVHIYTMLSFSFLRKDEFLKLAPLPWERTVYLALTESSTWLKALSSASMFAFFCCSSDIVRWMDSPFGARAVVGPEGIVGACRLFIFNGNPIIWPGGKRR